VDGGSVAFVTITGDRLPVIAATLPDLSGSAREIQMAAEPSKTRKSAVRKTTSKRTGGFGVGGGAARRSRAAVRVLPSCIMAKLSQKPRTFALFRLIPGQKVASSTSTRCYL
jgi:hypothetical protein